MNPRSIAALARRTALGYLYSPSAAIALGAFYALLGYLFAAPLFAAGQASLKPLLDTGPLLLVFLAPALTMSLLAEELRLGTFETLASFPLEDWDIVLGKFLGYAAFWTAAAAALVVLAVGLKLAAAETGLDWGETLGVLSALWLAGLSLGALGVLASSLGDSQAGAFVTAFALGFALLVAGKLAPLLPGWLSGTAAYAGLDQHVGSLGRGVWDTRDLFYFATLAFGALYLAAGRLEARRSRRRPVFSRAGAALVLGMLAAANVVSLELWAKADLSSGRAYSLSEGSKAVLARLDDQLLVRVYFTPRLPPPYGLTERYLADLLSEYRSAARGRVTVDWLDPQASETARAQAREAGVVPVQINVVARDQLQVKEALMGAVLLYKGRSETIPMIGPSSELEYELTRRIKRLVSPAQKAVGFVSGHEERDPGDPAMADFYRVLAEEMKLSAASLQKPFPAGLDALWVVAPKTPFSKADLQRLRDWLSTGKSLGLLVNRRDVDLQRFLARPRELGLEPLLAEWGLSLSDGFVVDAQCDRIQMQTQVGPLLAARVQDYPYIPIVTRFAQSHPAARGLDAVPFPFAHAVELASPPPPGIALTPLAFSSPESWLQSSAAVSPNQTLDQLREGKPGPYALAAVAEGGKRGRLILIGTGFQADPRFLNRAASMSFLLNLIEWSFQDEDLLRVRARGLTFRPLRPLDPTGRLALKLYLALALPLLTAAVWLEARRRRARRRRRRAALAATLAERAKLEAARA